MRKLLKYDLRAQFPIWAISSIAMLFVTLIGTLSLRGLLTFDSTSPSHVSPLLGIFCMLGILLTYLALIAYVLLNYIFILRRFYTHFYTDQGYLTFTLPVTRVQLMASKTLSGFLYLAACDLVAGISIAAIVFFGSTTHGLINTGVFPFFGEVFTEAYNLVGGFLFVYVIEAVLLLLVSSFSSLLIVYTCITVGAMVTKKLKLLAGIGLYYAFNAVISTLMQFLVIPFMFTDYSFFADASVNSICSFVALALSIFILWVAAFSWLLYYLNVYLLHKKLNLT